MNYLFEKFIGCMEFENACSCLRSIFSSDTCQQESPEWGAQEKERLFIRKSRALIGWKKTNERASLVYNLRAEYEFFLLA